MFFRKILCLIPGLQYLWRDFNLFLFSDVMFPVLLTSKAMIIVAMCEMSVMKCAYLLVLKQECDLSIYSKDLTDPV